jgi:anaerobic magnesium-protoporphyrin IX monomethyl ester cyclase
MRVLFIYSVYRLKKSGRPITHLSNIQPGISYLSAVLNAHGHTTDLVVVNSRYPRDALTKVEKAIREFGPRLIAFTAVYSEFEFIVNLARAIKAAHPQLFLLAGGPHVTLNAEAVPDVFDAVCVGEGEYPTLELALQLSSGIEPAGIPNLRIRRNGSWEKNPPRPFLQDLDGLPFPDRAMWERWVEEKPVKSLAVVMGRGCPFECAYCCNHALKKTASGSYVRLRSPENIASEIKFLVGKYPGLREIYLEVESVTVNRVWAEALCLRLRRLKTEDGLDCSYGVNVRITPGADAAALFPLFKKAGISFVNIGLESGSERVRRDVLRRRYGNGDVCAAVAAARENGLKVVFYNLIGVPGETWKDFLETVEINRRCRPERTLTSIFFPYPGTILEAVCRAKGYIPANATTAMERRLSVLRLPGFPKKLIERAYIRFEYLVYKGYRPLLPLLFGMVKKRLSIVFFKLNDR